MAQLAGVLAAIAGARIRHHDVNFFLGQVKGRGQFTANPEGALRAGPYRQMIPRSIEPARREVSSGAWAMLVHVVGLLQLPRS